MMVTLMMLLTTEPSVSVNACCAPMTSLFRRLTSAPVCVRVKNAIGISLHVAEDLRCAGRRSGPRRCAPTPSAARATRPRRAMAMPATSSASSTMSPVSCPRDPVVDDRSQDQRVRGTEHRVEDDEAEEDSRGGDGRGAAKPAMRRTIPAGSCCCITLSSRRNERSTLQPAARRRGRLRVPLACPSVATIPQRATHPRRMAARLRHRACRVGRKCPKDGEYPGLTSRSPVPDKDGCIPSGKSAPEKRSRCLRSRLSVSPRCASPGSSLPCRSRSWSAWWSAAVAMTTITEHWGPARRFLSLGMRVGAAGRRDHAW